MVQVGMRNNFYYFNITLIRKNIELQVIRKAKWNKDFYSVGVSVWKNRWIIRKIEQKGPFNRMTDNIIANIF